MNIHQFIQEKRMLAKGSDGGDYVYVFFNPATNLFKIGKTERLRTRLNELSNQNGVKLIEFLSCWTDGAFNESAGWIETSLHDFFKSKRCIGEWFNLSKWDAVRLSILFQDSFEVEYDYISEIQTEKYINKLKTI